MLLHAIENLPIVFARILLAAFAGHFGQPTFSAFRLRELQGFAVDPASALNAAFVADSILLLDAWSQFSAVPIVRVS